MSMISKTRTAKPSWDAVGIEWKSDLNPFVKDCNNFLSPNQTKHDLEKPEQTKWTKLDQTKLNKPIRTKQNKTVLNQWKQINQTKTNQPNQTKSNQTKLHSTKYLREYWKYWIERFRDFFFEIGDLINYKGSYRETASLKKSFLRFNDVPKAS